MDDLVKRQIDLVETKKKASVPWTVDVPYEQPYYAFTSTNSNGQGIWRPTHPGQEATTPSDVSKTFKFLALYSWNIDFMLPHPDSRMTKALSHLQHLISNQDNESTATVIFLAECLETDLRLITNTSFIQDTFQITDLKTSNWTSGHYGTTILADKRLPIRSCSRVHYSQTLMERDAFFLDITWPAKTFDSNPDSSRILRLCNTHLESLALEPAYRPPQMQLCAKYLHDPSVDAGIVAGDFNAIQDFDRHLHSDNMLKDAYLELEGGEDDAEGGHTWGQQAATVQRERFGTSRMDKVLYCGGVKCVQFERFGADVEVDDEQERKNIAELGFERPWITDHLGVKAVFEV